MPALSAGPPFSIAFTNTPFRSFVIFGHSRRRCIQGKAKIVLWTILTAIYEDELIEEEEKNFEPENIIESAIYGKRN
jgi:hypothetical protein